MTRSAQETTSRLSEIWREWGIKPPTDEARSQQQALAALGAHLQTGDPAILRAMQALLVDPEQPGAYKRPLFNDFWKIVQKSWPTAGAGGGDLLYLQAMLLATWPENASWLPPAMLSPWGYLGGRNRQAEALRTWRDVLTDEYLEFPEIESPDELPKVIDLSSFVGLLKSIQGQGPAELPADQVTQIAQWGAHYRHTAQHTINAVNKPIQALLTGLTQLASITQKSLEALQTRSQIQSPKQSAPPPIARMQEFLWWGQARYSHIARLPFRRVSDPTRVVWLAAREAAERAFDLPVEPAASYLQETLANLGYSFSDRRPLWNWLTELRSEIRQAPPDTLPEHLRLLLERDALGVPVSLLCLHPDIADDTLRSALGTPADAPLDLGEWAAWVFRELVFQHRWEEPTK